MEHFNSFVKCVSLTNIVQQLIIPTSLVIILSNCNAIMFNLHICVNLTTKQDTSEKTFNKDAIYLLIKQ